MKKMEIFENKVVCPRCHGNGLIYKALLLPIDQVAYICDECDATWLDSRNISIKNFLNFTTYVNSQGYAYEQIKINNKNYYWYQDAKLETFQGKVECPLCDGSGLVCKLTILPLNETAYVCDECEATWFDEDIRIENFVNLAPYVESRRCNFADVRYANQDYYWYKP